MCNSTNNSDIDSGFNSVSPRFRPEVLCPSYSTPYMAAGCHPDSVCYWLSEVTLFPPGHVQTFTPLPHSDLSHPPHGRLCRFGLHNLGPFLTTAPPSPFYQRFSPTEGLWEQQARGGPQRRDQLWLEASACSGWWG